MPSRFAFPILAALLAVSPFAAAIARADPAETALLGRDPGTKSAYACFVRHYDAPHMAAHPKQNVRDISMFVQSLYDPVKRNDSVELGFRFKGLKGPIYASGNCAVIDGEKGLACSIDCDGGSFNVTAAAGTTGASVGLPNPISMWDPAAPAEDENRLPKAATLGADDQDFALDRVDLKQCQDLMTDDAKSDIFGTKAAVK